MADLAVTGLPQRQNDMWALSAVSQGEQEGVPLPSQYPPAVFGSAQLNAAAITALEALWQLPGLTPEGVVIGPATTVTTLTAAVLPTFARRDGPDSAAAAAAAMRVITLATNMDRASNESVGAEIGRAHV